MRPTASLFALLLLISCASSLQAQGDKAAAAQSKPDNARPTLTQQKICAEQAKKSFDEYEQQPPHSGEDNPAADYTSHFDPQKNVCYVRISATTASKQSVTNSVVVYDAFERRVFANYFWVNSEGKKYWEVKPTMCEVHPQQQTTVYCHSSEEFNNLVEKWFGVAE